MTPVFSHGTLRLYLLSLVAEEPRHGYQIIQALTDRSGGTYSPSAGTIYPRLAKLEEEGLVTKNSDGRKTVYTITDAGRAELTARESELEGIETGLTDSVQRLAGQLRDGVSSAMRTLRADLASAAREATRTAEERPETAATASAPSDSAAGRAALADAELALTAFRQRARAELRTRLAHGTLDAAIVARLQTGLDELTNELGLDA